MWILIFSILQGYPATTPAISGGAASTAACYATQAMCTAAGTAQEAAVKKTGVGVVAWSCAKSN